MRQPEAEAEAARRNLEDEKRHRYVFYALDVSAGLSDDAWEVSRRLRSPEEALVPVEAATAAGQAAAADVALASARQPAPPRTARARPSATAAGRTAARRPVRPRALRAPRLRRRSEAGAAEAAGNGAGAAVADDFEELRAPHAPPARPAPLLRVWAVVVILIGVLFVATTLVIAFSLQDYFRLGALPVLIALAVGGLTVWLGVALWRA
jgi:hypothetical protein